MGNECEWEVECLIHCPQINIEQVDGLGMTPIAHALSTHHGRPSLAKLLLDKGAQPPDFEFEEDDIIAIQLFNLANDQRTPKHAGAQETRWPH